MSRDPEQIRRDIEAQREAIGDTVGALSYKTDVKARASDAVQEKKDAITGKVTGVKDKIGGAVPATDDVKDRLPSTPDAAQVKATAKRAGGMAQDNPLGLAIGSVAVGFLAGLLIPATKVENERIGPVADQLKEKATDIGQEAMEHGKAVAQEVAQNTQETVKETVKESGQEHAGRFQQSAQEHAQDVKEQVQSS